MRHAVAAARVRLLAAGLDQRHAHLDPEVLARHVLQWDRATWITRADEPASAEFLSAFDEVIARRAAREPVAYIIGSREFYGRDFLVNPDVLIPRPESELIIDYALQRVPASRFVRVVDVGTGSGALGLTLACERPAWHVEVTDVSAAAIAVARRNARALDVADRVTFLIGDLLEPTMGLFDVIVSNPPYVRAARRAGHDARRPRSRAARGAVRRPGRHGHPAPPAARRPPNGSSPAAGWRWSSATACRNRSRHAAREAGLEIEEVLEDLQGIARTLVARR